MNATNRAPRRLRPSLLLLLVAPGFAAAGFASDPATQTLHGLASRAEVSGPRGAFVTEIVSLSDGTARFVQVHPAPRGRVELVVVSGERAFERDEKGVFVAAKPGTAAFVLGHDAPRLAREARANARGGARPARLELPQSPEAGGGSVSVDLDDWRHAAGLELPFRATFVHSAKPGDRYVYRYTKLLPFRVAPGSPLPDGAIDPETLFERLGDLGELASRHEEVMAAHRASDAGRLLAGTADLSTVSGRGRLSQSRRQEELARLSAYLGAIRFSRYEDTAMPVVAVSADGTLGWLACEMEAEGTRTAEGKSGPIAYAFSWVELYARAPGGAEGAPRWRAIGNASSQRP
jgi:hypothetical protein